MKRTIIVGTLILIIISGIVAYNYIYQDHRDIKTEQADFTVNCQTICSEFSNNPAEAESKYLNKTIEVSGIVSELNPTDLTLNSQVFCTFINPIDTSIKADSKIKVKGRVIGYDDLLEQVKLDQCSVVLTE